MKTYRLGFDFEKEMTIVVGGIEIEDASVHVNVDADVTAHDTRETGGRRDEINIVSIKATYTVELPEDLCQEVLGHTNNIFQIKENQIKNHPDMAELLQKQFDMAY